METKLNFLFILSLVLLMFVLSACSVTERQGEIAALRQTELIGGTAFGVQALSAVTTTTADDPDLTSVKRTLDDIADLERSGLWFQGLAFIESGIRENSGDLAGAVAAAYKELSYAYGLGLIQKKDIQDGLLNVHNTNSEEIVSAAVITMTAFLNEQWNEASIDLAFLFDDEDEPDSFTKWMSLVCSLEKNKITNSSSSEEFRRISSAYRSIRARYALFPEYWYRGARAFSGAISAEFAENCINLSPQGPFADECRKILAIYTGLRTTDGLSLRTKHEIESIIAVSVNSGNPQILDSLLPLIGLPDNPYTVFAVSALRSVTNIPGFRDYFNRQARVSSGRLAERLSYISRS